MLPEERQLLTDFLNRFNQIPQQSPDPEANAIIRQSIRRPDAAYLLVQQAMLQEIGLRQAEQRIQALEQELQAVRNASNSPTTQGRSSFLGGFTGGGSRRGGWTDAPVTNVAPTPPTSSWNQEVSQQPMRQGGGFGSFLATAAATVAGVAGGALLFDSIQNFMNDQDTTNVADKGEIDADAVRAADDGDGGGLFDSSTVSENSDNSGDFLSNLGGNLFGGSDSGGDDSSWI